MKCNRKDCPNYDSEETENCKEFAFDCIHFKKNETFDLEWIPVTDEEKPGSSQTELLFIVEVTFADDKIVKTFLKGKYKNGVFRVDFFEGKNKYITHWARITLPGESE